MHVDLQILYTILAGLLLVVSALGTIFPILPGSLLAIGTLLAWGWLLGSGASWWAAGLGIAIAFLGWSASAVLTGRKLKRETVERAVHLSAEKYCSASIMLGKTAEMIHEVELVEAD